VRAATATSPVAEDPSWRFVRPAPTLTRDAVHLWRAQLDLDPGALAGLEATLAPDEREAAGRFVFPRDRRRFLAARGVLRALLGAYLRTPPAAIRLAYGAHGKPSVLEPPSKIEFNVAHSGETALYAVALARRVGVDLELIRMDVECDALAERFFSPRERAALAALAAADRRRAFFDCWARKEAYLKARGDGLSTPLDTFSVSLDPRGGAAVLETVDGPEERARWSVVPVPPVREYAAALVVEGVARVVAYVWDAGSRAGATPGA
jgi:4'-phosphopantetheinyl transferase